jgi:hypothetical protein
MSDALLESWITLAREMEQQRNAARALVRRLRADLLRIERYVLTADPADTQTVAIQARQLIDAQPWAREG